MSTSKPIIEVKHLSKVYNIGHEQKSAPGTLTFRDSIVQTVRKPLEIFTGHKMKQEKFWALKDVNFEVNQGDIVGIIGRNGSGKSTLLKVLSRIVEPTEGEIIMRGRVASLLEVGTGFHPELTGRENVYFNGAILGMSQKEIKSKFDEIVAFSEVEKFLDTPVKFYSSGMYVRLAFAVAAHLEPDILIVDEVLAVGDAAFQKKCLGKMKDVAGQGRTVLFVSHSMSSVQDLCSKGIYMSDGCIAASGELRDVIDAYGGISLRTNGVFSEFPKKREGAQGVAVKEVRLYNEKQVTSNFKSTDTIRVSVLISSKKQPGDIKVHFNILNDRGEWIMCCTGESTALKGENINFEVKGAPLYRGTYIANISLFDSTGLQDFVVGSIAFNILQDSNMLPGVSGVARGELSIE